MCTTTPLAIRASALLGRHSGSGCPRGRCAGLAGMAGFPGPGWLRPRPDPPRRSPVVSVGHPPDVWAQCGTLLPRFELSPPLAENHVVSSEKTQRSKVVTWQGKSVRSQNGSTNSIKPEAKCTGERILPGNARGRGRGRRRGPGKIGF